jgi:hypothetical protein
MHVHIANQSTRILICMFWCGTLVVKTCQPLSDRAKAQWASQKWSNPISSTPSHMRHTRVTHMHTWKMTKKIGVIKNWFRRRWCVQSRTFLSKQFFPIILFSKVPIGPILQRDNYKSAAAGGTVSSSVRLAPSACSCLSCVCQSWFLNVSNVFFCFVLGGAGLNEPFKHCAKQQLKTGLPDGLFSNQKS